MFNPKAWSNADLILEWIKIYTLLPQNTLFFLDIRLNVHHDFSLLVSFLVRKQRRLFIALKLLNAQHHSYQVALLALVQVCDTVINRSLKARIEDLADQYIDKHETDWVEGKYLVNQRRILLTKWVG